MSEPTAKRERSMTWHWNNGHVLLRITGVLFVLGAVLTVLLSMPLFASSLFLGIALAAAAVLMLALGVFDFIVAAKLVQQVNIAPKLILIRDIIAVPCSGILFACGLLHYLGILPAAVVDTAAFAVYLPYVLGALTAFSIFMLVFNIFYYGRRTSMFTSEYRKQESANKERHRSMPLAWHHFLAYFCIICCGLLKIIIGFMLIGGLAELGNASLYTVIHGDVGLLLIGLGVYDFAQMKKLIRRHYAAVNRFLRAEMISFCALALLFSLSVFEVANYTLLILAAVIGLFYTFNKDYYEKRYFMFS